MDQNADVNRGFHPGMSQNGKRKMGEASGEPFPEKQARMGVSESAAEHGN